MDWNKLKRNRCPQCGKDLANAKFEKSKNSDSLLLICACGFKITDRRMSEIVADKIVTEIHDETII